MRKKSKYLRDYRQKQYKDKMRLRRHRRAVLKKERRRRRQEFLRKLRYFLANPFKGRELNPDEVLRRETRKHARKIKRQEQRQWLLAFIKNPYETLFVVKKDKEQIIKEKWSKVDRKVAFRKKIINLEDAVIKILKTKEIQKRFGFTLIQSTTYFILSFLLIYVLYQFSTIIIARAFDIPVIWYYYRLDFPLYTFSPLYTRKALVVIFGIGPLLSLIVGFIALRLFFVKKLIGQNFKLFYLWLFINGMNFFFGSYISGFITRTEFVYTSEWLFMSQMFDAEEIVFASLSIAISIVIGRLVTPLFLFSSSSVTLITKEYRPFFMICQILIPWMTGALVFFLITTPNYYVPLIIKTVTPGLIVIPSFFLFNSKFNENIHTSGVIRKTYFKWGIAIALVAMLFFYRVILSVGLKFF